MYTIQTNCRACGFGPPVFATGIKSASSSEGLIPVFSLGVQPLANDFCTAEMERAGFAPLAVLLCPRCGLAQLSVNVRPHILYSRYLYVTSPSAMMRYHFERIWDDCSKLATGRTVVEIGSNDGAFLDFCRANGAEAVCGIEPAENLAGTSRGKGIETICDFFGPESASMALQAIPEVSMIFVRHVFCHVADWVAFMANLQLLARDKTLICIEVPYVMDLLKQCQFDTIYHEHLSYLSIRAIKALLNGGPFHLRKIVHYPIHGGAIMLIIERRSTGHDVDPSVNEHLGSEAITTDTWKEFGERADEMISDLRLCVKTIIAQGKRVVGYGASAKSSVWINACGFTKREISAVYDGTPEKWYRTVPGTNIPVVHEGGFYVDNPDYAICFAWNFLPEVLSKQSKWVEGGGHFIVPVPKLRVIGVDTETGGA